MVNIYTRKGDDGSTSLWYGGRVPKDDLRTEAYGALDEAGSALGLARALCADREPELAADILALQRDLMVCASELATAPEAAGRLEDGVSRIHGAMTERLERQIDDYMGRVDLPPKFVVPGGTVASAQLDVARATLRRAERRAVSIQAAGELASAEVLTFLNRASDLVFAMARIADDPDPELFEGRGSRVGPGLGGPDPTQALRERLLDPAEAARMRAPGSVRAAVLLAIYDWPDNPGLIFTERRHDMRRHPGQISFPGGRLEPGEDPVAAALREAEEEVGLPSAAVEVVGALGPVGTIVTDFEVHPVVGLVDAAAAASLVANPGEVAAVLALGIEELVAGHGIERLVHSRIPFETPVYRVGVHLIWGATARILGDFLERAEAPS